MTLIEIEDDWIDVADAPILKVDKATQTGGDNYPTNMKVIFDKATQTEDELFIATSALMDVGMNPKHDMTPNNKDKTRRPSQATGMHPNHDMKPNKKETQRPSHPTLKVFTLAQNPYNVSRTGQFKKFM